MIVNGQIIEVMCKNCHIEVFGHTSWIQGETGIIYCNFCHQPVVTKEWYEKHCISFRVQLLRYFLDFWMSTKMQLLYQYSRLQSWWTGKRKTSHDSKGLDNSSK